MAKKRTKRTPKAGPPPDWAERFLAALRDTGIIREACNVAGVGRSTVYERKDASPEFARLFADALEDAIEDLERTARKRAKDGSDTLMIFLLRAHRPEKYRERFEHSGPGGGPIPVRGSFDWAAYAQRLAGPVPDTVGERLNGALNGKAHP